MNKRILLPLALLFLFIIQSFANPIDVNTAQNRAESFYKKSVANAPGKVKSNKQIKLKLAYSATNEKELNNFYVFNREEQNGFIIVSGDDRTKPILGYADSGYFDYDNIPDNFKYWLEYYQKAIENLPEHLLQSNVNDNETSTSVEPLLNKISYNQDKPYNNLCPQINLLKGNAVTGCAATSMAQVMRYHKYPAQGIGSYSYKTASLKLSASADFANTTYDWDNMLETYVKGKYTDEQATAIATLMYHCGVAMKMDYGEVSSATAIEMIYALVNYFNYDGATIKLRYRDFYASDEWTNIIKKELNENRPVIYNGQSVAGGHSFVCDGYNTDGLFHINWGWGGQSDGYFALNILDPGMQGIGGGSGGFSFRQTIITGIQPLKGMQNSTTYDLKAISMIFNKESISGNQKATLSLSLINFAAHDFNGSLGLLFINANDENDQRTLDLGVINFPHGQSGRSNINFQSTDFPEGTYKTYPAYRPENSDEWEIMPSPTFLPQYVLTTTQDGTTTFSDDVPQSDPIITDFKVIGELVTGKEGKFQFTVSNTGTEFNQSLCIIIPIGMNYFLVNIESMYLADGETKTVTLSNTINLNAGTYDAYVAIYSSLFGFIPIIDKPLEITVLSKSTGISETMENNVEIYPNPATSVLYIHADETITDLQIINLSGNAVASVHPGKTDNATVNVETLPAGTYFVRIHTKGQTIIRKFIKQ